MRFDYLQPKTIEEAVSLLTEYDGKAKIIAGGTDLVVQMRNVLEKPKVLIDINHISGLSHIDLDDERGLRIGALTTIRNLEKSAELKRKYPVVSQAASQLGSVAIRNVATLGGNLCNAAPSAETAPALLILSAKAKVIGPDGERVLPLEDFFVGPGATALKIGELLVEVQIPPLLPHTRSTYLKHGIRGTIDLAILGVAVAVVLDPESRACRDIRIALGAVAPTPMRAPRAEEILLGKVISNDLINQSSVTASDEVRPISDVRASADYRKEMVKVFVGRAIREAAAQ